MGENVGQINLGLDVNQKSFNNQLQGISKGAQSSVTSAFGGIGKKIGVVLGGVAVGAFVKECLSLGSDLSEVQNVVDTTFTSMSESVNNFASNAMEQFGLSETVAKQYTGILGTMSKSMGFTESQAYDMATAVTGLAGDVASFYNISSDEAYTKLKSIWTGETESLKDLGVMLTQTNLDQYALNNGFGKTTAKMTEQEKVMLRYQYTLSTLGAAQGDFARTSDSWANQVRVLGLRFDSLKATLGQGFINLFTPIVKWINILLGKLSTLANAFVKFTELITGKKSNASSAAVNIGEVASAGTGLDTAADSASNLGSAISDTGKAAKKAAKEALSFASFDKVNVLSDKSSDDSGSSGSGSGGGTGGGIDTGLMNDMSSSVEESTSKMSTAFDKAIDKAKELANVFATGFKIGFGDNDVKPMLDSIKSIGGQLKGIFTDKEVLGAADNWVTSITESLGKITGSAASVGTTIGTFLFGSIDSYLKENSSYLKQSIIDMFDISSRSNEILANYLVAVADIFTVFQSKEAIQIGSDILTIFSTAFIEVAKLVGTFGTDLQEALTGPIINNKDAIKEALSGTLEPISSIVGTVKQFVQDTFQSIWDSYNTHIKPAFDNIESGFDKIFKALLETYNTYFLPVYNNIASGIEDLYKDHIKPYVSKLTDTIGVLIENISLIWDKTLAPLVVWIIKTFGPQIADIVNSVAETFGTAFSTIFDVLGDALDAIKGLLDFVTGVFTGDWEKAWTGIKDFFGGIIKGLKDLISPIGDYFKKKFDSAWTNTKNAFNTASETFKSIYSNIKAPFVDVGTWFKGKFDGAYSKVTGAFTNVSKFFSGVWSNIKSSFGSVSDWFENTFSKAWKKVKEVFSSGGKVFDGIKDGILNGLKTVINSLIAGINKVISMPFNGLNSALKKIRDINILGAKPFGFLGEIDVPKIPALAQGGYVKANAPQLAMIGDNKHEGEVVAPESKLLEMALQAAKLSGGSGGLTEQAMYRVMSKVFQEYMHIYIGEEDLARHVNRGNEMIDLRNNPVKGGA